MSWVAAAGVAVSAGIQGVKAIEGNKQKKKAEELAAENKFTPYEVPGEIKSATALAEQNFLGGMPGETAAEKRVLQNGASASAVAREAATSSGDVLDSITKIQQAQDNALSDLNESAARYKAGALSTYMGALQTQAGFSDKAYQINDLDPFLRKANTAAAMYGAGQINEFSGFDGLASVGVAAGNIYGNTNAVDAFGRVQPSKGGGNAPAVLGNGLGPYVDNPNKLPDLNPIVAGASYRLKYGLS